MYLLYLSSVFDKKEQVLEITFYKCHRMYEDMYALVPYVVVTPGSVKSNVFAYNLNMCLWNIKEI